MILVFTSLLEEFRTPPFLIILITIVLIVFTIASVIYMYVKGTFSFFEMTRIEYFKKKLFFNHLYIKKIKLPKEYKIILQEKFPLYKRLQEPEKQNFEHRVYYFLNNLTYVGEKIEVTKAMKVLIAATATKLTFGFRDYKIESIDKIIIYPKIYYSTITKQYHKGEYNSQLNALVFSWEDFLKGYSIQDDNINLAVHEFIHAIHFSFIKSRNKSTSAAIFIVAFQELTAKLDADDALKQKLITSKYLRDYAFENQFEFVSVLVENFIETPTEFRSKFPEIYDKVKEMLNFNFSGY